jgi:DNA-binding protein WhiA
MSFSTDVKYELLSMEESSSHCAIAKLAAILNVSGSIDYDCIVIHNENLAILEKTLGLISKLFSFEGRLNNGKIVIDDKAVVSKIISTTGVRIDNDFLEDYITNPKIVESFCCKRAYLRGAFVCCGSISDPNKQYHLEYAANDYDCILFIKKIISAFGIEAKIINRKNYFVLYLKEGEQIVDMLNIMAAHKALLKVENLRVIKDMRNRVNRIVNCETANLNKVVLAAVKQIESINYIAQKRGLDYLEKPLREIAELRLNNPDASLKELGELSSPQIGKSGVNHRLKKICDIAEKLKGDLL